VGIHSCFAALQAQSAFGNLNGNLLEMSFRSGHCHRSCSRRLEAV
jgi:hypothetical protein